MYSIARATRGILSQNIQKGGFSPRSCASTIAVKNLPFAITTDGVKALLTNLELDSSNAKVDVPLTANGKPKGWALLEFEDSTDAELAIDAISGHEYEGRKLKANMRGDTMTPKPPKAKNNTATSIDAVAAGSVGLSEIDLHSDNVDYFTELRIAMLNDKSRPTQEDLLADILYDDTKFFDENENDDGSLLSTSKLLKSKKEIQRLKKKAREDSIKYKDETPEERKLRIRAEAQEEEYIAACHAASRALVRPPGAPEPTDEMPGTWIETVVAVDRVQKIIKGGSIMSYRVLVVVGNAQGAGGFGIGKAADPGTATTRAIREAKKNIIVVDRYKNTALVHSVEGKHNSCRVVLRAVPPGWGTKGGKVVKTILEQMGISDCTGKAVGRRHPYAVVRATFKALARHTSVADISRSRGRRVLDVMWRSGKE